MYSAIGRGTGSCGARSGWQIGFDRQQQHRCEPIPNSAKLHCRCSRLQAP